MAWTTPRTWTAGESPSASTLNTHIRDDLAWLYDPPAAKIWLTSDQTGVVTATWTDITGFTEAYDTDGIHTSSNSYLQIVTAGRYLLNVNVRWAANGTGGRGCKILEAASPYSSYTDVLTGYAASAGGTPPTTVSRTMEYDLDAGQRLKIQGWQDSGGNRTIDGTSEQYTLLEVRMVAP